MNPIFGQRRKPLTVYVPGGKTRQDHEWLTALRKEGPVVVAPEHPDHLENAFPGAWTWLAPKQREFRDLLLQSAARVEGPRKPKAPPLKQDNVTDGEGQTFAFCCVADSQYIPFFFALVENLKNVHAGSLEIHLLALEPEMESIVRAQYPQLDIRIYSPKEIWGETLWERVSARSIPLQAFSSKPRMLLHARRQSQQDAVFLLDLDLFFYHSPMRLNEKFGVGHTLLFPQWSDRFSWARLHGIINSGMVGAKKGSEAFLSWWSQACWISCESDAGNGRFVDQGFIDQAVLYFDGIQIYRELDENVAAWNRQTLKVKWDGPGLCIQGYKPVRSFHAAGPDDDGIFEHKFAWDQMVTLFSVFADPDESLALFRNTLDQQRRHWPSLDRALRLRSLVKDRLKLPVADLNPEWADSVVSGLGAWVLGGMESVHGFYRGFRGKSGVTIDTENGFWVDLQRRAIFQQDQLLS